MRPEALIAAGWEAGAPRGLRPPFGGPASYRRPHSLVDDVDDRVDESVDESVERTEWTIVMNP
jgi:hypothetical protein